MSSDSGALFCGSSPDAVSYSVLLERARTESADVITFLKEELPYFWAAAYWEGSDSPPLTNINRVSLGTFEYLIDDPQMLEATVPCSKTAESRLVAVLGVSSPRSRPREDTRLRGWVGPTNTVFGSDWDKGHFIGHALGGAVDGFEANVFVQRRDLNRGWSDAGRIYAEMEKYCAATVGVFCFSRPIYVDETARPAFVEFGLLKTSGQLWVERFVNRLELDPPA